MGPRIVRASGYWNLGLAATLLYPPLYRGLGLNLDQPVWGWLIAGFLAYTSATLILGSRDLSTFRWIILSEAALRFLAAALLIPAGAVFGYGLLAAVTGAADLAWGLALVAVVSRKP